MSGPVVQAQKKRRASWFTGVNLKSAQPCGLMCALVLQYFKKTMDTAKLHPADC